MIYHFVTGTGAADQLHHAMGLEPSLEGTIVDLTDPLNVGPLAQAQQQSFSEMRTQFRSQLQPPATHTIEVSDLERVLEACNELAKSRVPIIWIWVAPNAADICSYYFILQYASKYPDRIFIVNIEGLPFLDDEGKIFYPKKLDQIPPKEIVKARILARPVTANELELDTDAWKKLLQENAMVRINETGRKIGSRPAEFFDEVLLGYCLPQSRKLHAIVHQAQHKGGLMVDEAFLGWRLWQLAEAGKLLMQADPSKPFRDAEFKLPSAPAAVTTDAETPTAP